MSFVLEAEGLHSAAPSSCEAILGNVDTVRMITVFFKIPSINTHLRSFSFALQLVLFPPPIDNAKLFSCSILVNGHELETTCQEQIIVSKDVC